MLWKNPEIFAEAKKEKNSVHPLIMSSIFHYEFVFILPFADGNGRMARLWHTAMLAKCHVEGESTIFIEFMLSQIDRVLDDISVQIIEDKEQLSEHLKRLLEVMEYDAPYTSNTLMDKLGLKSKEGFRRNYIRPAIDMNLMRMTIPDRQNSRNQRYVKE
uniref:Fic family protein n=1 Tax=Acetatifactor sp. TaxID=1872090 RepID=UPI0040570EA3